MIITLNPDTHIYTNNDGVEYTSVTRFINKFVPIFDFDDKSKKYAYKYGRDLQEVRDEWTKKNLDSVEFGTKIHSLIENAIKDNNIIEDSSYNVISEIVFRVKEDFKKSINFLTEKIIFNEQYKIAGTADLIVENENSFSILDFKTNKQIKYTNDFEDKFLLKPVNHLPNSEYFKYSLQLSFYAYFFSLQTGKQVDRLAFYWLKRSNNSYTELENSKWVRYNVPYLKEEIIHCLNYNDVKYV